MRSSRALAAGFLVLAVALAPGWALARAGGGASMGSRGTMTYSAPPPTGTAPYSAAPFQRSMTPRRAVPGYGPRHGTVPYYQGRSPFMSGLLGGLLGAGIAGLLFGHGFLAGGLGLFGLLGLLLQFVLIIALVRWLMRTFLGGGTVTAGGPGFLGRGMPGMGNPMAGARPPGAAPVQLTPSDYQEFEQLLKGIQAAWSAHDLNALRAMTTPEMLSYFGEQLAEQVSRGVRNQVSDVRLLQGDLSQAWAEGNREYATVAMRFSMIDVTRDMSGRIVDGSADEHVTATEVWTFVRSRGGHWVLSAIQQAR